MEIAVLQQLDHGVTEKWSLKMARPAGARRFFQRFNMVEVRAITDGLLWCMSMALDQAIHARRDPGSMPILPGQIIGLFYRD